MKALEAFVAEIRESDALQKEFCTISSVEALEEFLKKNDCDATAEEFAGLMQSVTANAEEGELSDEDVETVAGGTEREFLAWLFKEPGVSEEEGMATNIKNMNAMDDAVTTFFTKTLPGLFKFSSGTKTSSSSRMYSPQAAKSVKVVSQGTDINKNWR
ncbi:MAG: hypothetical protein J5851_06025 [Oscillospiraceae bacterium]|nr:hypothetical protein [Oscillospiraceae bacterium]